MLTKRQILSSLPHLSNKLRRIARIRIRSHSFILYLQVCYLQNSLWREHSTERHVRHDVRLRVRWCFAFIRINWTSIKPFHFYCFKISKTCAIIEDLKCRFVKIKKFGISISDFLHKLDWRFLNEFRSRIWRNIGNLNVIPCWLRKRAPKSKSFPFTRLFQSI